MIHPLVFALLAVGFDPSPITSAQAVREWTFPQGTTRLARMTGVVTHANSHLRDFFLQDETAGIYIGPSRLSADLTSGDRVEVFGLVDRGTFAPFVAPFAVRKVGRAPLPEPEMFDLSPDASRWLDGQFVQVDAFVRRADGIQNYASLAIVTSAGIGRILVPGKENLPTLQPMVGKTIRIRGVCVPRHDPATRQILGRCYVYVGSANSIKMIASQQPRLEPATLKHLQSDFSASPLPSARPVVVVGTVTAVVNDREFVIQDDTGGASVHLVDPGKFVAGQRVSVNGFLNVAPTRVELQNAAVMNVEAGLLPEPQPAPIPFLSRKNFGRRIRVRAALESTMTRDGTFVLNLRSSPETIQGIWHGTPTAEELSELVPGATVEAIGVAYSFPNGHPGSDVPVLLLKSLKEVEVVEPPPGPPSWWTGRRISAALAGFAGVIAFAAVWVWSLHRQVRKQTRQIEAQYQRELQLNESLRQSRKLEAVGRLAGGIAHDFNNLLTVILGNSELAAQTIRPGDPARELITTACDAAEKAAGITKQLLTFSRHGPVELQPIDLNAALVEVERLLQRMSGPNARLSVSVTAGLPAIKAEPTLIHQILFNLVANSRDALESKPGGGDIEVGTTLAKDDCGETVVRLTVRDNGCGMDETTRARVFEPFFTTKDVGKGTGLGLATVYGIMATLDGKIHIESQLGHGTSVSVDFRPLGSPPAAVLPPPVSPSLRQARILLVDDEDSVREVCRLTLQMYGYTVITAGDPIAALETERSAIEPIDLLVTDVVMPGMNGQELAIALRSLRPNLPILFVSGYPEEDVARFLTDLDRYQILCKPFTPLHLAIKVQDMLEEVTTSSQVGYHAGVKPSRLPK